jgi:23S rRNA pseudouridine1911/1915/1917 synthase
MSTHHKPLKILYEDNHVLAVVKPAMLPTMGVAEGTATLLTVAKQYIRDKHAKLGGVYLGIVSRLDAPVTGVVLLARTSKSAARLCRQFRERSVDKIYWAAVENRVRPPHGRLVNSLCHDKRHRKMRIASPTDSNALEAALAYKTLPRHNGKTSQGLNTLLEIALETGRKHQIRLQFAHFGHPILGDRKYGSRRAFPSGIALHCHCVVFDHPVRGDRMTITAPLPRAWQVAGLV